jgi:hypothetical protein
MVKSLGSPIGGTHRWLAPLGDKAPNTYWLTCISEQYLHTFL